MRLRLFVAGNTIRSQQAIANLNRLRTTLPDHIDVLDVVDVLKDPGAADVARIVATPTLIREAPEPARRIVGDLSDLAAVARCLDLQPPQFEVSQP